MPERQKTVCGAASPGSLFGISLWKHQPWEPLALPWPQRAQAWDPRWRMCGEAPQDPHTNTFFLGYHYRLVICNFFFFLKFTAFIQNILQGSAFKRKPKQLCRVLPALPTQLLLALKDLIKLNTTDRSYFEEVSQKCFHHLVG